MAVWLCYAGISSALLLGNSALAHEPVPNSNQANNNASANSLLVNTLSNAATENIQNWLRQYANVRLQLNTDQHFDLKNSQLDLLLPLRDRQDNLLFNQTSIHRTDHRSLANLGLGWRYFDPQYTFGSNLFVDYDLSHQHARGSFGLEYWRDYLKLSSNAYVRLTNWKAAADRVGYDERVANGIDVWAEGYLPSYPQLGAKLVFAQYAGDNVDILHNDQYSKNPYSITTGLNYTPIPLLTLGVDQQFAKGGNNNTQLNLQLTYRFGIPFKQQSSADYVSVIRTVKGNRYDFVNRDNNIVFDYRQQQQQPDEPQPYVPGPIDPNTSTFIPSIPEIHNNDSDASTVTLTTLDANNYPITGLEDRLTFVANPTGVTIGTIKTNGANQYYAKIEAPTTVAPGEYTIEPRLDGKPITGLSATIKVIH